jgi:hypothetical protein
VTMLEIEKGIEDVPLHLVGQMLKLWEDKWVTETKNEIWWSHKSWQQFLQNESFLQKWIHVIRKFLIENYSGINRYVVWNIVRQHFCPLKIDTCLIKNYQMFIDKVRHNGRIKKVYMYHISIL